MKFKMVLEGDLDKELKLTASMGPNTVKGTVVCEHGRMVTKCPNLVELLPERARGEPEDPEDPNLEDAMESLSSGIMDFFGNIHGNV